MTLTIAAPVPGTVHPLSDVPDNLFAELVMGPGCAIEPFQTEPVANVISPVNGVILSLQPHAFVIEVGPDRAVLVHLGLGTIEMDGRSFSLHARVGQAVERGQCLMEWSPAAVIEAGHNPFVPVIALQAPPPWPINLVPWGELVGAGQNLLDWP